MSGSPFIGGLMFNVLPVEAAEQGGAKQFSPLMALRWQRLTHAQCGGKKKCFLSFFKSPSDL